MIDDNNFDNIDKSTRLTSYPVVLLNAGKVILSININ